MRIRHVMISVIVVMLLTACGAGGKLISRTGSMNSYDMIQHEYKNGHIMKARAMVLELDKAHTDYARAHRLLNEKIEPARRRIFVHYLRLAKDSEKKKLWAQATLAYKQAKGVTIKPELMEQKRVEMEHKMRQMRLEKLIEQRRKEDESLWSYASAYVPANGLSPKDEVYLRQQEVYNDALDERAARAYKESRRYLRAELYGPAYVEIESHLRLQPDSARGVKQMQAIKQAMPAWLKVPKVQAETEKTIKAKKRVTAPKEVKLSDIQNAIKKDELPTAKRLAQVYRRNGGKGADKILSQIQKKLDTRSAELFVMGSRAFRQEQLNLAIQNWGEAVALTPENTEYVEALNRAKQLKERLNLLRSQKDNDPIPEEE
ncbi:hypothetical protein MMIC_P0987 [Mariprofundus micogutta]|uniref:Tetratricopeptide repeat protein n=1 Tax=Mariprofundus micogutta TaxID=1921010 RepID=A0A1L8CM94_9PROT|nr:hypothetical protein [Mariprofundus micogutta]GAV20026.1 hypothetical protein MMIC_P0987 [Mariprofundus micogutta]